MNLSFSKYYNIDFRFKETPSLSHESHSWEFEFVGNSRISFLDELLRFKINEANDLSSGKLIEGLVSTSETMNLKESNLEFSCKEVI